ncbi:MAG TPA: ArsC/Spx/MgsR family protein [Rhodocyclaceae bacterium]
MAEILFFEKSGCSGNTRQKAMLEAAGHTVVARDLRDVAWSRAKLLSFLEGIPVALWFNRAAPDVKSGEIVPEELDECTALGLLQNNPLLIRRPLMEVAGVRRVGFDAEAVHAWIGLGDSALPEGNLEACSHAPGQPSCKDPRAKTH